MIYEIDNLKGQQGGTAVYIVEDSPFQLAFGL
jgi:hypothetical protein